MKVCLFYEGHFDCERLNGQNDNCMSGTDASDGNDLSTTVVVTLSLALFWHCLLKEKCPMSIEEVKCPKVLTCRLLSRKRLNLIKCYKFTFLLHLCFSERSSVRPRLEHIQPDAHQPDGGLCQKEGKHNVQHIQRNDFESPLTGNK